MGQLDVALVRECPADPRYDAVLAVEETLGVILATVQADKLADRLPERGPVGGQIGAQIVERIDGMNPGHR